MSAVLARSRPLASRALVPRATTRLMSTAKPSPMVLKDFSMAEKVCLITGAARGLGNEFARAFVRSGCTKLAIVDLNGNEAADAAQELISTACLEHGGLKPTDFNIIGVECDVSSERSVQKAFGETIETFGRVDAVVASAGIVENYAAFDYPFDRIKRLYDINVHGAFFTARESARHMIPQGGGSITLVSSMSANVVNIPQPQTPYNASKAAVKHMAASLAVEWAKKGVRVNTLSPGYMLTKLTRTILAHDQELKKTWESLTPMGRMGEPEDLAGAIVFLASDASRFMTGSEIRVDGGYTII
ncbi:NAD(P)-binding protein [Amylostereum chailletii]|nr:NAD(P)-binding protein [Amylostereum chailletii]